MIADRRQSSQSALIIVISLIMAALSSPLHAAEIKAVKDRECTVLLTGDIEEGDAKKLKATVDKVSGTKGGLGPDDGTQPLCLDSQGGSYPEALKIIDVIIDQARIPTVIKRGSECYSACALVFLAGSYWPDAAEAEKQLNSRRTLFPGGKLGFHAPYAEGLGNTGASKKTIDIAVKVGINSIVDIMDRNEFGLFPDSLLRKALRVEANKMFEVTTIADAARWDILVPQQVRMQNIDKAAAIRICENAFAINEIRIDDLWSTKKGKDEEGIDEFTIVYLRADGEAHCQVSYSGTPGKLSIGLKLDEMYLTGSNWLYLLDSKTRIDSLQGGGQAVTASTQPSGKKLTKGTAQIFRNYDFSGADIDTIDAASADACAARCAEKGACTVFSYNRWAKKCFLKSSFASARFEPRSVSGKLAGTYKPGKKPDTVQNFRGRKFKDKPSRAIAASSFEDCLAACLKDGACIAINFHKSKRQCQFFGGVNEYFPDAEYDAAMRWEAP